MTARTRRRVPWLVVALAGLQLAGCGTSGHSGSTNSRAGTSAVTIGTLDDLTGPGASSGLDTVRGAELAVDVVDEGGAGVALPLAGKGLAGLGGAKLRLVTYNTRGDQASAVTGVDQLVRVEHAVAITGAYASALTEAASTRAEALGVPLVNGTSSTPSLTQRGLRWFFRTGPTDETFARDLFAFLGRQAASGHHVERIAILHTADIYGTGVDDVTRAQAARNRSRVVADVGYDAGTTDLTQEVRRIQRAHPNVLFAAGYRSDAVLLLRTLRDLDYYPDALLGYGAGFTDPTFVPTLGSGAEGVFTRAAWSLDGKHPNPVSAAVARLFQQRFRQPMTESSARSFTATMILATAISNARSTDANDIRRALESIDVRGDQTIMPWRGVRFDAGHQNVEADGLVLQVHDGRYRVVHPAREATTVASWPLHGTR